MDTVLVKISVFPVILWRPRLPSLLDPPVSCFIFSFIYLNYGCAGSFLHRLFSSGRVRGLLSSYGVLASHCSGFSCCRAQALGHMGFSSCSSQALEHRLQCSERAVVVNGLSCSKACGIFLGQGSNPGLLHWRADSYPLHHQGRPTQWFDTAPHV